MFDSSTIIISLGNFRCIVAGCNVLRFIFNLQKLCEMEGIIRSMTSDSLNIDFSFPIV